MRQNVYEYAYELKREKQHRNSRIFLIILSVVLFLSLFFSLILFPVLVRSDSMESGISKNGTVFVTPASRTPQRGDVIFLDRSDNYNPSLFMKIVNTITGFFTAQQYRFGDNKKISGKPCIRRVLALPGDSIYMKDYVLYVKPKNQNNYLTEFEIVKKPYSVKIYSVPAEWDGIGSISSFKERTLSENEYFVLADNRIESSDSRIWGAVNSKQIKGKVVMQYFPFTKIHLF